MNATFSDGWRRRLRRLPCALLLAGLLAGCGGGSSGAQQGGREQGRVGGHGHGERGGSVGAEGVERPVAERELAVKAGQDVQAEDRDRVHHDQVELEHAVVLEQEGQHQQRHHDDRAADPDPLAIGGVHTRVTTFLPNSPSGFSVSVATISTSATVSFSSVPIT